MGDRNVYDRLGIPRVVNAVGFATRVGGSCPSAAVLEAMRSASESYVEIDDLQSAASRLIAQSTGAEMGLVTCGAAAGLTLSAAACMVGNDVEAMDRLPDVSRLKRNEIIYPKLGPFDYEHPLRASGAKLIAIDYASDGALERIAQAISPRTAAIGYCWLNMRENPAIDALAKLAHGRGLPLIVDGALSLPPVENLRRFISLGADLVTYSGGKHLGGPQASAILCGRSDLIRSAWVQMLDMDVREGTWSLQSWIEEAWIARPPRHGIGRSMKVGKEAVIGLMTALQNYLTRDHAGELKEWTRSRDKIAEGLTGLRGVRIEALPAGGTGQPDPVVRMEIDPNTARLSMSDLVHAMRGLRPKIIFCEDEQSGDTAFFYPMCLAPGDADYIVSSIRAALS